MSNFRIEEYFGSDSPYWQVVADFDSKPEAEDVLARANTAWDLLAALKHVMGWIDAWNPSFKQDPEWPEYEHHIRVSIAKAEGR